MLPEWRVNQVVAARAAAGIDTDAVAGLPLQAAAQ